MYTLTDEQYLQVGRALLDAVRSTNYFSGSLRDLFDDDTTWCLTASVIVYRTPVSYPEGVSERITGLIPVWWEFRTGTDDGLNDFSFDELTRRLGLGQ